jgi:hypothetical protein
MKPAIRTTFLIFLVFAAFSKAETNGNSGPSEAPSLVTISVFDRANVPTELLTVAEEEARRIFRHAGVETTWLNCSKPLAVRQSKAMSCGTIGAGYLVVEILPRANSVQLRFRLGVLGTATLTDKGEGFYCYLFYDRIERLSGERLLKHRLLADVLAHETGHLMLGSNSHSLNGIMSGQWSGEGLRRVSEGAMFFDPSESRIMRQRLNAKRAHVETSAGQPQFSPVAPGPSEAPAPAAEPSVESYVVFNATATQEVALRAQIRLMHPPVLPLRVLFVPHWKYLDAARRFQLHVPTGFASVMFTHLPSRTVFIDNDRYLGEDWLGHWMAHELGHLATNSVDEHDADKAAREFRRRIKYGRNKGLP